MPFIILTLLVGGLGVVLLVFVVMPGEKEVGALKDRGVTTQGRVSRVWTRHPRGGGLRIQADYQFQVGGQTFTGTWDGVGMSTKVGDTVTITYLPESPSIHRVGPVSEETVQTIGREYKTLVQILFFLFSFLFVFVGLFAILPNWVAARKNVRLVRYGTPTRAVVTAVSPYGVSYSFEIPGQGKVTSGSSITGIDGNKLEVGDGLTVLYDPKRPRRYALYRGLGDFEWLKK
jgi:hypothetical protein